MGKPKQSPDSAAVQLLEALKNLDADGAGNAMFSGVNVDPLRDKPIINTEELTRVMEAVLSQAAQARIFYTIFRWCATSVAAAVALGTLFAAFYDTKSKPEILNIFYVVSATFSATGAITLIVYTDSVTKKMNETIKKISFEEQRHRPGKLRS